MGLKWTNSSPWYDFTNPIYEWFGSTPVGLE